MSEYWASVGFGIFILIIGFLGTHVRGAMPGSKLLHPMPRRVRVILITGGGVILGYGLLGLFKGYSAQ